MFKMLLILLVGLSFESTGIVFLKRGMNQIAPIRQISVSEVIRILKTGVTNPQILLGILFQALFFACLLVLMSRNEISFLWPLTGLSFVFATFAATWFLHEQVSSVRWLGVALIVLGAGLISYSEQIKKKDAPAPAQSRALSNTSP